MNTSPSRYSRHALVTQTGVVLLLCLLFLTALTLLGLSASAETIMQDTLTSNLRETQRARQSALAAQEWAEHWLLGLGGAAPLTCAQPCEGLFIHSIGTLPVHPEFEDLSWWLINGNQAGLDPLTGELLADLSSNSFDPQMWLIELVHEVPASESGLVHDQAWYRIVARGSGQTPAGVAVVESIITRPWTGTATAGAIQPGPCPGSDPNAQCRRVAWRALR